MIRFRAILALIGFLTSVAFPTGASAEFRLSILHTNDVHSRIEPINRFDSTCGAEDEANGACFGGFARIAAKIRERRATLEADGRPVLVLDAGDQFQGSLFYTEYKGTDSADLMNRVGYDAMALGNHEFDDGPANLARFIDAVRFPVLSGNTVVDPAEALLAGKITPRAIVERGGEKIAILSVLATDTDTSSSPGPNVRFVDEIGHLRQAVAEVRSEGIDKIVLLSHVGIVRDREIAAAVDGIDIIVGGHSHTLMSNRAEGASYPYPFEVEGPGGRMVPIVQAYAYSKYLGEIELVFDDDGDVTASSGETHLLDATVVPDPEIAARVAELGKPLEAIRDEVVGETTGPVLADRNMCRFGECSMGNLVADAVLERMAPQGVEIVITNGGGLRASIDAGPVTMGEVLTVLPFQNTVATFRIRGSAVLAALEHGLSGIEEGAGRFPQVAGIRFVYDPTASAGKGRVHGVEVLDDGGPRPLDPQRIYTVATNNYLRAGGDGYAMFVSDVQDAYDFGPNLEDVVAEHVRRHSPYAPVSDGRVSLLQDRN